MRILCLMHVPFEGPAEIATWAAERGHPLTTLHLHDGQPLPEPEVFDFLTIMGGPMGVHDEREYPWLGAEKRFIEQSLGAGKQVLGVCLGAQLLADVLGATIRANEYREIGWHEVRLTEAGRQSGPLASWPSSFMAFHWHGDTFDLPAGAVHLAASEACRHQAFSYGQSAVGLQFHVEYSTDSIEQMLRHCGQELREEPYIQSAEAIRGGYGHVEANRRLARRLLDDIERVAAS